MIALLPNCGFLSETSRMLHLAQALRSRGEEVVLGTHGGPYLPELRAAGLPVEVLNPVMTRERQQGYLRDLCQIGRPGLRLQPADEVRASVQAEVDFLRRTGARAAVTGFTLTAFLSARVVGIPLVTSHGGSYVPPVMERGLAPVPTTMSIPGTEWFPRPLKRFLANHAAAHMKGPTAFLNEVAAELGVEPVPTLAALMIGDLALVTDLPEVLGVPDADLRAWSPRGRAAYRREGQLVYSGPLYARLDVPVPEAVRPFLDRSAPTACVVLSSSSPEQLRAVVARVRAAGVRVIVGATIHDFGPVPDPGVVVAGLLPNHAVFPQVDLVVGMGGQGTVQTAMASGTPYIGIPLHAEQELNVALAVRQGMAVALAPRHAGSERMTQAVRQVLADGRFRQQAVAVRALYAPVDGAARGADEILRWLPAAVQRAAEAPLARAA